MKQSIIMKNSYIYYKLQEIISYFFKANDADINQSNINLFTKAIPFFYCR